MCTSYTKTAAVSNQQECQSICVQDSKCVGILYSYREAHNCYTCTDDNLKEAANAYGFYRRPGNVKTYEFELLTNASKYT